MNNSKILFKLNNSVRIPQKIIKIPRQFFQNCGDQKTPENARKRQKTPEKTRSQKTPENARKRQKNARKKPEIFQKFSRNFL